MRLGYARVSTGDQSLDGQCQRLSTAGCDKLFEEKISGATRNRPQLDPTMWFCSSPMDCVSAW